jgi:hypothetical protein
MKTFWVSCSWATGQVDLNQKCIIQDTPMIWKGFQGQRFVALIQWLEQTGKPVLVIEVYTGDPIPSGSVSNLEKRLRLSGSYRHLTSTTCRG